MSLLALGAVLCCAFGASPACARRVAVVVANADYDGDGEISDSARVSPDPARHYMPDLGVSRSDADQIEEKLRSLGFEVQLHRDADQKALQNAITSYNALTRSAGPGDVTIFYYTGHSVQVEEALYLIPAGALVVLDPKLGRGGPTYLYRDTATEALVSLGTITPSPSPGGVRGFNLIILDSCRDNPWPDLAIRGVPSRGRGGGSDYMASVGTGFPKRSAGTIVVDAASPGSEALGINDESPFTSALVEHLADRRLFIDVFAETARKVREATGGAQQPQIYADPFTELCLSRCATDVRTVADESMSPALRQRPSVTSAAIEAAAGMSSSLRATHVALSVEGRKPTDIEVGGPFVIVTPPIRPSPPPRLNRVDHAHYFEMELQETDYSGEFLHNKPHGLGRAMFNCAMVMLRARCPLSTFASYSGDFRGGKAAGRGEAVDLVTGTIAVGRFGSHNEVSKGSVAILLSGELFVPDGSRLIGEFEQGKLRDGARWDPYLPGWIAVREGHDEPVNKSN